MFFSQVSCTLNCLTGKATFLLQDFEKIRAKVTELEAALLKVRPHSLSHLTHAVSETFPPLRYFEDCGGDTAEDETMSLNGLLLHGLRKIEERNVSEKASSVEGGEEEGVGLPVGGDLPNEAASTPEVTAGREGEREGEREGGRIELAKEEGKAIGEESATSVSDVIETTDDRKTGGNSDPQDPVTSTLNPTPCSNILPSYATAVTNPFHPVLKGLVPMSKGPDSTPKTHQSESAPPPTNTARMYTPFPMATVAMDTHINNHHDNQVCAKSPNNHQNELQQTTAKEIEESLTASDAIMGDGMDLASRVVGGRGEGLGAIATSGPAGWSEWSEELCTPRSESSLSLKSTSSSGEKYTVREMQHNATHLVIFMSYLV